MFFVWLQENLTWNTAESFTENKKKTFSFIVFVTDICSDLATR